MEDLSNYGYIAGSYKRFSRIGDRYINTIRDDFGSVDEFISSIGGDNAVFNKELSEGTVGITEKQRTDSIGRNPDWTDEEIILALELYFNCGRRQLDSSHKDVIKLSELLNNLSIHSKRKRNKKFRNPNGVATKLGNILSLDPERSGGLPNVSKRDIKVWDEYSNKLEELYARAQKIKNDPIIQGQASDFLKAFDLLEASEGESKINMHNKIERNKTIIRYKKLQVLEKTGKLECEACEFDFQIKYGDVAHGVCECHHIVPLFKLKANTKTTIDDLAILCCNCHQAIHLFDPIISVNKLKTLIGKERKKQMEMLMK
jgi:5-methylcytosine-specific restriction protein A